MLGIGCRKGTPQESIEQFVQQTLAAHRLSMQSVSAVASIDLKAQEEGLLSFCAAHRLPFVTYDAQSLFRCKGEFSPSAFVQQVTGVDNVSASAARCCTAAEGCCCQNRRAVVSRWQRLQI